MNADCFESDNVLCKHWRSTVAYYVDFNLRILSGLTIQSVSGDTQADDLDIDSVIIVNVDTVLGEGCNERTLIANRAVKITLSGGTPSDDEVVVTVQATLSDGQVEFVDCRLIVGGAELGS